MGGPREIDSSQDPGRSVRRGARGRSHCQCRVHPVGNGSGKPAAFIVLAPQGGSTAKAAARVAAADGTVVADYSQIGVLVARTTNPDFATAVAGAGVESVAASTTGLGTQLDDGITLETADAAAQAATETRPASRCGASSGTCR